MTGKHDFTLLGDCTERWVHGCECTACEHTIVHELANQAEHAKDEDANWLLA